MERRKGLASQLNELKKNDSGSLWILIIFIVLEFGRVQNFIPVLQAIKPGIIITILLAISFVFNDRRAAAYGPEATLFLALLVLMSLHVPLAANNFHAFNIWKTMLVYFLACLNIIIIVDSPEKLYRLIRIWVIVTILLGFVGLAKGGLVQGSAILGDENDFSLAMNTAIPICYLASLVKSGRFRQFFWLSATVLLIFASVRSFSRGGFLGLVAVLAYLFFKTKKVGIIILLVFSLAPLVFFIPQGYVEEMKSIFVEGTESGTGANRWFYWKMAVSMFLDNPIIGVGQGNFPWRIGEYEPIEGFHGRLHGGRTAHSLYFTILSELGTIGTLLFLGLLFRMVIGLRHTSRIQERSFSSLGQTSIMSMKAISVGLTGSLFGYLITGAFLTVPYYPYFWFLLGLCIASRNIIGSGIDYDINASEKNQR